MKIGAASWCFTYPHYEPPYEEAVDIVGKLGVDGIEMIANTAEDLETYYTETRCRELKSRIDSYGLEVSEFVLYAEAVMALLSRDDAKRNEAIEIFKKGVEVAKRFGTGLINIVSNWPDEFKAPVSYMPYYIHPAMHMHGEYRPKMRMDIPNDFDAAAAWDRYLDSISKIVTHCEKNDISFVIEGHANVLIGTTDAILRAFDKIDSDSFGTNFDTAWQLIQREYLPWSILKLGKKVYHVHVRDGDGILTYNLPVGQGIIDWHAFVQALKRVGYKGFLSLEFAGLYGKEHYARESIEYLRNVLKDENALG